MCGTSAATFTSTGAPRGNQNSRCRSAAGTCITRSTSMPSCTTVMRALGTPSAASTSAIALDAAMKQATWRYFHRENECFCKWKSTRREATSVGTFGPTPNERAIEAMATACGS